MAQFKFKVAFALMVVFLFSCATARFEKNAYKSLSVSKELYETTFTALGELYRNGDLDQEAAWACYNLAQEIHKAYGAAVNALAEYHMAETDVEKEAWEKRVIALTDLLRKLIGQAKNILIQYSAESNSG